MRLFKNFLAFTLMLLFTSNIIAQSADDITRRHIEKTYKSFKLDQQDVESWRVADDHISRTSGVHHIYIRQEYKGIEIQGATMGLHIKDNQVFKQNNQFIRNIAKKTGSTTPTITAIEAVTSAANQLGYTITEPFTQLKRAEGKDKAQLLSTGGISVNKIPVRLMYQPMENGELYLAWDMSIFELGKQNYWSLRVDATTGKILDKINWTLNCSFNDGHVCSSHNHAHDSHEETQEIDYNTIFFNPLMAGAYRVYAMPIEDPAHGSRTLVSNPDNAVASPYGWHDTNGSNGAEYTTTRGNNVNAYEDGNNSGFAPNGGSGLTFDYTINTTYSSGTQSESAVITNLFYWSNLVHDVWYQYGFDEASGNYQENNYGNGGSGGDPVRAEAQDGSGTCNANFSAPTDGTDGTMQMYVCGSRDGSLDNGVVVHEYGHGISIRLAGGRNNSGCLSNTEQMGEGWSDWFGLMMTIENGDAGTDTRGIGNWLVGNGINGPGIRTHPYSTNMNTNPHTYSDISSEVAPHGVGSVWCAMLWEMTWGLIGEYGFDSDFYTGNGGNNIAMALVIEGLKLQPCSPGFEDGRDAILAADQALYNGANQCIIWEAFAKRGMGYSASQGSSGSKSDGNEAFDMPPSCTIEMTKTANVSQVNAGGAITYTLTVTNATSSAQSNVVVSDDLPENTTFVSATNGGTEAGGTVSFPATTLAAGASASYTFTVQVDPTLTGQPYDITDGFEAGLGNWTATSTSASLGTWVTNGNSNSGSTAMYAQDFDTPNEIYLTLTDPIAPTATTEFSFFHSYNTEVNWDGGRVQYSSNNGASWSDLGSLMTQNGYNDILDNDASTPGFSGNSGGYIETKIDLSSFEGQIIMVRFWMHCDPAVGGDGWYVDDVTITDLEVRIPNTAQVTANGGLNSSATLANPTLVLGCNGCPTCIDGIQNGNETDVDCGGPDCPACPTCNDGIQNQGEEGIDCGGPCAAACPSCNDGIQNQDETGVDCGGSSCPTCPPSCTDGIQNGTETGVDCGGSCPNSCPLVYCNSNGQNNTEEYIANVTLENINNTTTTETNGYGDYTNLGTTLDQGGSYTINLTPDWQGTTYDEYFRVWIDFNKDGDFDDAGELAYDPGAVTQAPLTGTINVPTTAAIGVTTMRVTMKYVNPNSNDANNHNPPTPCESFPYGEVEDYAVNILAPETCTDGIQNQDETGVDCGGANCPACETCSDGIQNQDETGIDCGGANCPACPTASCDAPVATALVISGGCVKLDWPAVAGATEYRCRYRQVGQSWIEYNASFDLSFLNDLKIGTDYEFQVKTKCDGLNSVWSSTVAFTTAADNCDRPNTISHSNVSATSALIAWSEDPDDIKYKVGYKPVSGTTWTQIFVTIPNLQQSITGLTSGTDYKYRVKTKCSGGWTNWTAKGDFTTLSSFSLRQTDSNSAFKLYPNPAHEVLNIEFDFSSEGTVEIFDILGRTVISESTAKDQQFLQINIASLQNGSHYIRLMDGENQIVKKFVKF